MIDHVLQIPSRAAAPGGTPHVLPSGLSAIRTARLRLTLSTPRGQRRGTGGRLPRVSRGSGRSRRSEPWPSTATRPSGGHDLSSRLHDQADHRGRRDDPGRGVPAPARHPLDEWLPELRDGRALRTIDAPLDDTVPAKRPLMLRDLLTFRSGYCDFALFAPGCPFQKGLEDAGPPSDLAVPGTPDESRQRPGRSRRRTSRASACSHTSAQTLGVLIARVSGSHSAASSESAYSSRSG